MALGNVNLKITFTNSTLNASQLDVQENTLSFEICSDASSKRHRRRQTDTDTLALLIPIKAGFLLRG